MPRKFRVGCNPHLRFSSSGWAWIKEGKIITSRHQDFWGDKLHAGKFNKIDADSNIFGMKKHWRDEDEEVILEEVE